jgi:hypothetical protein
MDFKKLSLTQIILIGGFAVLLIWAINSGVFQKEKVYETSTGNATDGSAPTKDTSTYKNIAINFRRSMLDSYASFQVFETACQSLLALNDSDLIQVANEYGGLYVNQDFNTLRSVLVQEWAIWPSSQRLKKELLERFNKIGI